MYEVIPAPVSGNVRPEWPFLYPAEYEDVCLRVSSGAVAQVVQGARGSGKSTFVRALARRYGGALISGRRVTAARGVLESARVEAGNLFIDDVDHLLRAVDGEVGAARAAAVVEEIAHDLIKATIQRESVVIVSYANPWRMNREFVQVASLLPETGQQIELPAPWSRDWRTMLHQELDERYGSMDESTIRLSGKTVPFDRAFLGAWLDAAAELTAGHPTLLAEALIGLQEGAQGASALSGAPNPLPGQELRALLRSWLELQLVGAPLAPLRRRLASIRSEVEPSAYESLIRAAMQGGSTELSIQLAPRLQQAVQHHGLGWYDAREGRLHVPGTLLHGLLTQGVITLMPDSTSPEERGYFALEISGTTRQVLFTGQSWRILQALYASSGRPVPTEELVAASGAPSDGAVRALVQRIKATLDEAGVRGVIGVERRLGYYLQLDRA